MNGSGGMERREAWVAWPLRLVSLQVSLSAFFFISHPGPHQKYLLGGFILKLKIYKAISENIHCDMHTKFKVCTRCILHRYLRFNSYQAKTALIRN